MCSGLRSEGQGTVQDAYLVVCILQWQERPQNKSMLETRSWYGRDYDLVAPDGELSRAAAQQQGVPGWPQRFCLLMCGDPKDSSLICAENGKVADVLYRAKNVSRKVGGGRLAYLSFTGG